MTLHNELQETIHFILQRENISILLRAEWLIATIELFLTNKLILLEMEVEEP